MGATERSTGWGSFAGYKVHIVSHLSIVVSVRGQHTVGKASWTVGSDGVCADCNKWEGSWTVGSAEVC